MIEKRFAARVLGAIGIVAAVLLFAQVAHCAIATKKHDNSLGVVQYQTNPFTYIEGSGTDAFLVGNREGLVLRVQPRATYALFTEDILFCNPEHVLELLQGKSNPFVLTYERVTHRTVQGIGCHNLVAIDEVKTEKNAVPRR